MIPSQYWAPHGTQNIPNIYHAIPHGIEHPHGTQDIPHGTHDIPHGTAHTLYRVKTPQNITITFSGITFELRWLDRPFRLFLDRPLESLSSKGKRF